MLLEYNLTINCPPDDICIIKVIFGKNALGHRWKHPINGGD